MKSQTTLRITIWLLRLSFWQISVVAAAKTSAPLLLQTPHPIQTPQEALLNLAQAAKDIETWDVYGDFSSESTFSYLREFEAEIAAEFGKDDAVFMPSGVMAQSIALLIHHQNGQHKCKRALFACHPTSHLLLYEQEAFRELLGHEALVLTPVDGNEGPSPLDFATVQQAALSDKDISTLILEIPHRELGGQATSWEDIQQMSRYCRQHDISFHCDGARIFEATSAYEQKALSDLAEPFDSVYISFYKGLASLAGAMLMGSNEFCAEARVWLRRMGGNLYTLLPYVVGARRGYDVYWKHCGSHPQDSTSAMTFVEKRDKLRSIVQALQADPTVSQVVTFVPQVPQVNMVHGCFEDYSIDACTAALDQTEAELGVRPLHRIRTSSRSEMASMFEWYMGEANGRIPDDVFVSSWQRFATLLLEQK